MTCHEDTTIQDASRASDEANTLPPEESAGCFDGKVSPLVSSGLGLPARLLSAQLLLEQLDAVLPRKPCHRTLQRWARAGLPYILHPGSQQRLYLFREVYDWLCSQVVRRDIEQEAIDRSYPGMSRKKSLRKSA